ncbi:MAG: hypothetical protein AAGF90_11330 [Pseudomonadota bacterium]
MSRAALFPALAALAACGAEPPAPEAAAPEAPERTVVATSAADGSIRVTGPAANEDALDAHHCFAAKRALSIGATTLEWVGGIAKKRGDESVDADLAYETGAAPRPVSAASAEAPAEGGAAPVERWLIYCDEAGIPREGQA